VIHFKLISEIQFHMKFAATSFNKRCGDNDVDRRQLQTYKYRDCDLTCLPIYEGIFFYEQYIMVWYTHNILV